MHVLFGLLVPPEKQIIEISGYAPSPNWPKLEEQRLQFASRQNSDTNNKEQNWHHSGNTIQIAEQAWFATESLAYSLSTWGGCMGSF